MNGPINIGIVLLFFAIITNSIGDVISTQQVREQLILVQEQLKEKQQCK